MHMNIYIYIYVYRRRKLILSAWIPSCVSRYSTRRNDRKFRVVRADSWSNAFANTNRVDCLSRAKKICQVDENKISSRFIFPILRNSDTFFIQLIKLFPLLIVRGG